MAFTPHDDSRPVTNGAFFPRSIRRSLPHAISDAFPQPLQAVVVAPALTNAESKQPKETDHAG